MMEIEKLLNPWLEEEEEEEEEEDSDMCELSDESEESVTRTLFMSWFATKAASVFLGMKEEYIQELEKLLPEDEEEDDDYAVLLTSAFSRSKSKDRFSKFKDELIIWWINKAASLFVKEEEELLDDPFVEEEEEEDVPSMSNMVGLTDLSCEIRNDLIDDKVRFRVGTIVGMAGIGKTLLAKKILQDPLISNKFECRIFVRLGPKYQPKKIVQAILAQMPDANKTLMVGHGDLFEYLHETLKVKKFLIVLDDVWDRHLWSNLLSKIYPREGTKSGVLVTTRTNQVADHVKDMIYDVPMLNKNESWVLLRGKVFGENGSLALMCNFSIGLWLIGGIHVAI